MKAHILILNYNGEALLESYLPSLVEAARRAKQPCRISVLDNCSRDRSKEIVERYAGRVGWIAARENKVLCSYNEVAPQLEEDILIFMNNDIRVEPDFVDGLLEPFLSDPDVFFVTPKCFSEKSGVYEGNRTRAVMKWGAFWASSIFPGYESGIDKLGFTIQGGFGAFDRKKFIALNGYDDLFLPGRLEDADLCFRAQKRGWKCLYQPKSVVYHRGAASFHKEFGVQKTLVINWKNTFLYMVKNISEPKLILQTFLFLPLRLIYSLLTFKPEMFLGFLQSLVFMPEAFKRRKALKAEGYFRAVPDSVIFGRV